MTAIAKSAARQVRADTVNGAAQRLTWFAAERDTGDSTQKGDQTPVNKRPRIIRNRYNNGGAPVSSHGLAKKTLPLDPDKTRNGRKD